MISVRSCPAQKPRPAPVRRIARQVLSATASSSAAASAAAISTVSAFNRSGRFSVIRRYPASFSTMIGMPMTLSDSQRVQSP